MFLISPRIIVNETSEEGKDHCASSSRIRGCLVLNIKHRFYDTRQLSLAKFAVC